MPDIVGIALFPVGYRGNEFDRQNSNSIGTNNYCRTLLFDFSSYSRIKIDEPYFTPFRVCRANSQLGRHPPYLWFPDSVHSMLPICWLVPPEASGALPKAVS